MTRRKCDASNALWALTVTLLVENSSPRSWELAKQPTEAVLQNDRTDATVWPC